MKKIMILGASILQIPAIIEAKKMGLYVIAVDMNPDAEGFKYADKAIVVSTTDTEGVLREAKKNDIDGILTVASDRPMITVARVVDELGLHGVTKDTAEKSTIKSKMRDALKEFNVPIPKYYKVTSYSGFQEAVEIILNSGSKVIAKPADNSASRGVRLIDNIKNLDLQEIYNYCKDNSYNGELMVEEYMEGPEVSVETISYNGECHILQITDKITTNAPYFVEMGHTEPSSLPKSTLEEIARVTKMANIAIGNNYGPSHTEIRITNEGPKIVELGARTAGENIATHLVPYSTGINMVECCINLALGNKIDIEKKFDKFSAIRYKKCDIGKIKNISGIEQAEAIDGVKVVTIVHGVGEYSEPIKNSNHRVAFVISQADDRLSAVNACEKAIDLLKFEVEENV
ncbi:ATP-grasp domain-containing protein [uncultured Anaerococcus sp.]|uniref:ATP-grasp domain-containing protein n=1 Tax=uncultured Anaerococcus sp. TaxID=293428 RepID=UPI0025E3616C|nr:ATP-grasp domain-containing protein [uncultured Anaerococcus sp.]